jgi:hypothetical protein
MAPNYITIAIETMEKGGSVTQTLLLNPMN